MTTMSVRSLAAAATGMALIVAGCACEERGPTLGVGPRLEVRLFAEGVAPAEGTELANDAVLDFGVVKIQQPHRRHFALRNGGSAPMAVQAPSLEKGHVYKLVDALVPCSERDGEPSSIPIGDCSTFIVEYNPAAVGDHSDVLIIRSDDKEREEVRIRLVGRGATGLLEACIASTAAKDSASDLDLCSNPDRKELLLDYGLVPMGSAEVTRKLRLTNTGELPLNIPSVKPAPDDPVDFAVSPPDFADTLAPGESVELGIVFRPSEVGDRTGTITVEADEPYGAPVKIKLASRGDAPRLCIEPNPTDFGNVGVGQQAQKEVGLRNCGSRPLQLSGLSLEGDSDFIVQSAPLPGAQLQPNASAKVTITFRPTSLGPRNGRIRVESNDQVSPVAFATLVGKGFAAPECDLRAATTRIDFGAVEHGTQVVRSSFFSNAGGADCNITGIRIDNAGMNAQYIINQAPLASPTAPARIVPNGTIEVKIAYQPLDAAGPDVGNLELLANDPKLNGQPLQVELYGTPTAGPECRLTINPPGSSIHTLRFGATGIGDKKVLPLTLKNDGSANCQIGAPSFGTLADRQAFSIDAASPPLPTSLAPGQVAQIDVAFQPRNESIWLTLLNYFTIQTNDTVNGVLVPSQCGSGSQPGCKKIGLDGRGVTMAVDVVPGTIDFGVVTLGCRSREAKVTFYNIGAVEVEVTDIFLDPANASFRVSGRPSLPRMVPPGGSFDVAVRYTASATTTELALLTIEHALGQTTIPLKGTGTTESYQVDNFQQNAQPRTDVLWVVDNSCSMSDKQAHLSTNAQNFITSANATNGDYQVAVISTDTMASSPSTADRTSSYPGTQIFAGEFFGVPSIIKRSDPDPAGALAKNIKVGQCCSDSNEAGLEAAKIALSNPLLTDPAKPNSQFLRSDAKLAIIVLSDEEDQSSGTVQYYVDYFQNLKGAKNTNLFAWHSIVGDAPSGCRASGITADAGGRYIEATTRTNGIFRSICATDWGRIANDIGLDAFAAKTQFFLSRAADPATLQVTVNGAAQVQGTDYDFESNTNSIVFRSGAVPPAGASIKAEYDTLCL